MSHGYCEIRNQYRLYGRYSYKIVLNELQIIFTIGYNKENSKSYAVIFVKSFHTLVMKGAFMLREPLTINPKKVEEIVVREEAEFRKRTPRSHEIHERAKSSLPMGSPVRFKLYHLIPCLLAARKVVIFGTMMATNMRTSTWRSEACSLATHTPF